MGQIQSPGTAIPPLPNSRFQNGDPGSCGPMGKSASTVKGSNERFANGDPANGFMSMARQAGNVHGSNEQFKFKVGDGLTPQPPSVLQPGVGAVPVRPNNVGNGVTGAVIGVPDTPVRIPK
jgi:hypothetical protein